MSLKAVLFDLDGTLLPMNQDMFINSYLELIADKFADKYDPKTLIKTIWDGTTAMVANNGERTNEELFWRMFGEEFGESSLKDKPLFDKFYTSDFESLKEKCGYAEEPSKIVAFLRNAGVAIALATNPIFPRTATEKRARWAGLEPSDFKLVTSYENSRFCKPNPAYYSDIAERMGVTCKDCLMVGNDVSDDMSARKTGMTTFLLTNCLINRKNEDISEYPNGGFSDLLKYIEDLLIK